MAVVSGFDRSAGGKCPIADVKGFQSFVEWRLWQASRHLEIEAGRWTGYIPVAACSRKDVRRRADVAIFAFQAANGFGTKSWIAAAAARQAMAQQSIAVCM